MTNLSALIDPEVAAKMKAVACQPKVPTCSCTNPSEQGYTTLVSDGKVLSVHAGCGWPSKGQYAMFTAAFDAAMANGDLDIPMPRLEALLMEPDPWVEVTTINGVEYDVRSEALANTQCVDCHTSLTVEIAPQGVDLTVLTSKPRQVRCLPCALGYTEGKSGQIIHRPITIHPPHPQEEPHVTIDLSQYSEAELNALVNEAKARLAAERAERLIEAKPVVEAERAEAVAIDEQRKVEEREARKGLVLPEFTIKGKTVPAFDLSEVGLGETPSAKERSPYNKALHALGMSLLDSETTTYNVLVGVHTDLLTMTEQAEPKQAVEPEPEPEPESEPMLVAKIDPDEKAAIKVYAKARGIKKAEARRELAGLGLL